MAENEGRKIRRRISIPLKTKIRIIRKLEVKKNQTAVAREENLERATVNNIWKFREKYLKAYEQCQNGNMKKCRRREFEMVDDALVQWFKNQRDQNTQVSGPLLQEMAMQFAKEFSLPNFKASSSWLDKWKRRYSISLRNPGSGPEPTAMDSESQSGSESESSMTSLFCSLPWCRKPIPSKRQCKRFPHDRPTQLAWLDALDAGTWFSIPQETLSTGLVLCGCHFDSKGNVRKRYESSEPTFETVNVKLEPEDVDAESEEEFEDSYAEFNDDERNDPDYTEEKSSKSRSGKNRSRQEFKLNIVQMKEEGGRSNSGKKTTTAKVKRRMKSESGEAGQDNEYPGASSSKLSKTSSSVPFDDETLARMTKAAFKAQSKQRDQNKSSNRISLNLMEKMEIIRLSDRGMKQSQIARKIGIKKSTVWGVIASRDKIEEAYHCGGASLRRKVRKGTFDDVNQALYAWYQKVTSQNLFVNTRVLMSMADGIAAELGRTDFKGSQGWLDRFKQRYNIRFGPAPTKPKAKKIKPKDGNESTMDPEVETEIDGLMVEASSQAKEVTEDERVVRARDWLKHIWEECRIKNMKTNEQYLEKDIFFVEEIGILYRITPKLAWQFRSGIDLPEFSITDERITVLLCANADGSEKRKLLVTGGKEPGIPANLPADYSVTTDSSNWITKPMFTRWLNNWNSALQSDNRKIVVLLSGASIHMVKNKLSHITLAHIPIHHLAVLQPANHGISRSFRARYRRLLLERLISGGSKRNVTCVDALFLLSTAWNELPSSLVRDAFIKAGFFPGNTVTSQVDDMDEFDCANLLAKATELGIAVPQAKYSFLDYVAIDESLYAVECSISGIVGEASEQAEEEEGDGAELESYDEDLIDPQSGFLDHTPVPCNITNAEAQNLLQNLRTWAMSRKTCPLQVHNALSTLESFILGHHS